MIPYPNVIYTLILCMLGNFVCFCHQQIILKLAFSENSIRNTIRLFNSLDLVGTKRFNLGPSYM